MKTRPSTIFSILLITSAGSVLPRVAAAPLHPVDGADLVDRAPVLHSPPGCRHIEDFLAHKPILWLHFPDFGLPQAPFPARLHFPQHHWHSKWPHGHPTTSQQTTPQPQPATEAPLMFADTEPVGLVQDIDVRLGIRKKRKAFAFAKFFPGEGPLTNETVADYLVGILSQMDEESVGEAVAAARREYLSSSGLGRGEAEASFERIKSAVMGLLADRAEERAVKKEKRVLASEAAALLDLLAEDGEHSGQDTRSEEEAYQDYYSDASDETKDGPTFLELLTLATKHKETKAHSLKS